MSFGQKQQELWSKAAGAFVKSNKSNDIGRKEGEDWEVWWQWLWVLEDADRGLPVSEEVVSTLNRVEANRHGAARMGFVRSANTRCDPVDVH